MDIQFCAATDVGRQREHNEDNYLVDPRLQLFVVADGMGGHAAGEVASQIAVHELCRAVREHAPLIDRYRDGGVDDVNDARQEILGVLEGAIQHACAEVFRAGQEDAAKRGMGTTTVALLLVGDRGFLAHVGDSRVYLVRQGQVHQLTEDHSLLNELVRRGKIKRDEFERSPYAKYKNAVTRAVGANETVEADTLDFELLPGDQFLLCSDGLHFYTNDAAILAALRDGKQEAARWLVTLANERGGHDNITAVVVSVRPPAGVEAEARISDLSSRVGVLKGMPLFKHLSYKEVMRVLNLTQVREYQPGERIFDEGSTGDELLLIVGGRVRLHKGAAPITTIERGAHFGEMALVDRSPRSASATAEERTRVLILRRSSFYEIIRKEPPLATKLLWSFLQVLTERLRKTTAELSGARLEAQLEDLSEDALFEDKG